MEQDKPHCYWMYFPSTCHSLHSTCCSLCPEPNHVPLSPRCSPGLKPVPFKWNMIKHTRMWFCFYTSSTPLSSSNMWSTVSRTSCISGTSTMVLRAVLPALFALSNLHAYDPNSNIFMAGPFNFFRQASFNAVSSHLLAWSSLQASGPNSNIFNATPSIPSLQAYINAV